MELTAQLYWHSPNKKSVPLSENPKWTIHYLGSNNKVYKIPFLVWVNGAITGGTNLPKTGLPISGSKS
jgi:hypothetical protein